MSTITSIVRKPMAHAIHLALFGAALLLIEPGTAQAQAAGAGTQQLVHDFKVPEIGRAHV